MKYFELQEEIKTALKSGDKQRVSILRQVHGELKNIEVDERREIEVQDVTNALRRLSKQTGETLEGSIKAATNQERTDLLKNQVAILESYLPRQVSGKELSALIDSTIAQTGASTKKDMGRVMAALGKATGANFDKAAAAKELTQKLQ
jgi:uncharacterized protein YqeY